MLQSVRFVRREMPGIPFRPLRHPAVKIAINRDFHTTCTTSYRMFDKISDK